MSANFKVAFEPYLNVKNALLPSFSADGKQLYYLSDLTGTLQVWSVPVAGGWPDQLTFYQERVNLIEASPAGNGLVMTRDRGGDEQDQLYWLQGNAAQGVEITPLMDQPSVKHNFGAWQPNGGSISFSSNQRHPAYFDVYTLGLEPGAIPKLVYQADNNFYPVAYSHSGQFLLVLRANSNMDFDLFLIDLTDVSKAPRLLTPHTPNARFAHATFAKDDRGLYLTTDLQRDFMALAYLNLETLEISFVATPDWDVENLSLSPDGQWLAYTVNQAGYHNLLLRQTANGTEKKVEGMGCGTINGLAWSRQSDQLAFDFTSPTQNSDVWLYSRASQEMRQVTYSPRGGLNPASFVEPQIIHFPSFDGLSIPAQWYLPPAAQPDNTTPVILYVHGGPESQVKFAWSAIFQYFVRRGYAVLAPNVRGSSGYGNHYQSLDDVRKRMDSVADLKAAVEWLGTQPQADPKKIAVYGGSYGGFMVLSAITVYPDLWAAAVDIVGIANLISFFENTSSYRRKLRASEYGDPATDYDFLVEISPIHKVDRIKAPLMVIHGARDPRVPVGEAEQIVASLRARQHPVEYQLFEDEGHGITKLKNKLALYPLVADFLNKHLLNSH